jgi:CRP/FNR family transcriptional regulator, cyclic AMP receptor protein
MSNEGTPSETDAAGAGIVSESAAAVEAAALDAAVESLAEQSAAIGRTAAPATVEPPPPPPPSSTAGPSMAASLHTAEETTDIVELLAKIHIFAGLQPAYLRRIAAVGTREQHQSGATVFSEGSEGDKMYLILSGAVRISRQVAGMGEEALAVLRAGNYFGEMSLVDESPRSADAKAHEATELLVLKKDDLEDLLFVDRDLAYDLLWNFVRTLTSRLRDTNDKMTFLAVTNRF